MNEFYSEVARKIPIFAETDVLVVGGGPAGMSAAVAAARTGAKTMLIEKYGFLGGNITTSMVESMSWYRQENTVESGGIGQELEERLMKANGAKMDMRGKGINMDSDVFKIVADELIEESKVTPIYHILGVYPMMEGNKVIGVITESKSGRCAILSKITIDATGDGDIAALAGVPFAKGDSTNGKMMAATTNFGVSAVNVKRFMQYIDEHPETIIAETHGLKEPFIKAKENNEWSSPRLAGAWHNIYEDTGEMTDMNFTMIPDIDGINVWDLTKAEILGRKQVMECINLLRKYQPGFENCRLRTLAPAVGIRETRRMKCEYSITGKEIMNHATYDDSIGVFPIFLDDGNVMIIPNEANYFQIPYRNLIPKKVENLLVTGRCIDSDRNAIGAIREMMCCSVTGQAAGVAAAVAVKDEKEVRNVSVKKVQDKIRELGIRIF